MRRTINHFCSIHQISNFRKIQTLKNYLKLVLTLASTNVLASLLVYAAYRHTGRS